MLSQRNVGLMRSEDQNNQMKKLVAEFLGTAFLVAAVIGSGIMAERLSNGNIAIALLANTIATCAALVALILAFGPISGAHFNPAVSLSFALSRETPWREVPFYWAAQFTGGLVGAVAAHAMFALPWYAFSTHVRSGAPQLLSEFIATFGLVCVIWGCVRSRSQMTPFAVGAYIASAYWFTASTSFANPAVTVARAFSNTFAGIRPTDAVYFIPVQIAGAIAATFLFRWLMPDTRRD
jgi:glycerol uptake facilitator-like aquaporin